MPLKMQEIQVRSLGWEDPLEKKMAPDSSILAWKIPRTEEPGRLQSMGSQRVGCDLATKQQQRILYLTAHFILFLAALHSMWDHSSLTRIEPTLPALEAWSLKHWTTREVPISI